MMDQLCEKKCDCQQYDDMGDHRSALIKMELPDYEDGQYGGTSYTIFRALRFIGYIIVLVLLGYSLWRIHVIESTLLANERFNNISKIIALENNYGHHRRVARFVDVSSLNSFVDGEKPLPRGSLLTSKNESPLPPIQKPKSKEDFQKLVNNLFDKIKIIHDDPDRNNFDNNIKEVFQAWFPVFDALLPQEIREDSQLREKREIKEQNKEMKSRKVSKSKEKSSEERSNPRKSKNKSSKESSEEKHSRRTRSVNGSTEDSSVSSSEEKMIENVLNIRRPTKKNSKKIQDIQNNSKESSEESKLRNKRSSDKNSGESVESSEENVKKFMNHKDNSSEESSEENMKKFVNHKDKSSEESSEEKNENIENKEKNSSESMESSESNESLKKNKKNIKNNYLTYEVVVPE